jgi:hypothetical protein
LIVAALGIFVGCHYRSAYQSRDVVLQWFFEACIGGAATRPRAMLVLPHKVVGFRESHQSFPPDEFEDQVEVSLKQVDDA